MKQINLYQGATNAQRKKIDANLKARMQQKIVYQTSVIVPGLGPRLPPLVKSLGKPPYSWRMA